MTSGITLPSAVQSAVDAANKGDRLAFVQCFASDGVVDDWGRQFTGHAAIGEWSDSEFIGVDVSLEVQDAVIDSPTTAVTAKVGGSGFNGPSTFTFTVVNQQITLMAITA